MRWVFKSAMGADGYAPAAWRAATLDGKVPGQPVFQDGDDPRIALAEHEMVDIGNQMKVRGLACAFEHLDRLFGRRDRVFRTCLLYTSPSPRDGLLSRMPSSA